MRIQNVVMFPEHCSPQIVETAAERERIRVFALNTLSHLYPIMVRMAPELGREDDRERCGLYAVIMRADDASYWAFPVGTLNIDKAPAYLKFALEKPRRLRARLGYGELFGPVYDEVASYQSRDEAKERYGGAIITDSETTEMYSASGLPEYGDEAFSLVMAIGRGRMRVDRALVIGAITGNPYIQPLLVSMGFIKVTSAEPVAEEPAPAITSDVVPTQGTDPETPAPKTEIDPNTGGEPTPEVTGDAADQPAGDAPTEMQTDTVPATTGDTPAVQDPVTAA